jgi:uncharacterized SAM-binding protein YcdF (DUF218 family)
MNAFAIGLIGSFLLPPKVFLLPAIAAWLCLGRWPRAARRTLGALLASMWIFSTPAMGNWLLEKIDRASYAHVDASLDGVQAIVVLAGGRHYGAREFAADTVDADSLERARRAALLHKRADLPLLVAGGRPEKNELALADLLSAALNEYGVQAQWRESESKNTAQNAANSARILLPLGISRIALVTHGTHMIRAKSAFERAGFTVVPQSVGLHHEQPLFAVNFLPSSDGMVKCEMFFHEILGLAWYWFTDAGSQGAAKR